MSIKALEFTYNTLSDCSTSSQLLQGAIDTLSLFDLNYLIFSVKTVCFHSVLGCYIDRKHLFSDL